MNLSFAPDVAVEGAGEGRCHGRVGRVIFGSLAGGVPVDADEPRVEAADRAPLVPQKLLAKSGRVDTKVGFIPELLGDAGQLRQFLRDFGALRGR